MTDPPPNRTPVHLRRDLPHWRTIVGSIIAVLGVALFALGNVASRGGIALPFDRHHVFTQMGGLLLSVYGLVFATRRRS